MGKSKKKEHASALSSWAWHYILQDGASPWRVGVCTKMPVKNTAEIKTAMEEAWRRTNLPDARRRTTFLLLDDDYTSHKNSFERAGLKFNPKFINATKLMLNLKLGRLSGLESDDKLFIFFDEVRRLDLKVFSITRIN